MKRLTAYVSGRIQKVGYRARVIDIAGIFGLKGTIQNLSDGRVKVIAEGEENDLERFLKAIDIRNTTINVTSITKEYSDPICEFDDFYKQVRPGETDSRLDKAVFVLNDILGAVKEMNANLGGKIDNVGIKVDNLGNKVDNLGNKVDNLGGKVDNLSDKVDNLGGKMDQMLEKQDQTIEEIQGLRQDIQPGLAVQIRELRADMKAVKDRLGMP